MQIFDVVGEFEGGTDISDATATASDILNPETSYTANGKVTGTMMPTYGAGGTVLNPKVYDTMLTFSDVCFEKELALKVSTSAISIYKASNDSYTDDNIIKTITPSEFPMPERFSDI